MLIAAAIQAITSVCAAFSTNYMMFVFFRFLIAFSVSGVFECGFVLGACVKIMIACSKF